MKKSFFALAILLMAILACQNPQAASTNALDASAIKALPQEVVVSYDNLDTSGIIYSGQGVLSALYTACNCGMNDIKDGGIIVERNGEQALYISDKRSLNNLAFFENTSVFTVQPGDVVYFGKVKIVAKLVQTGTLTAQTTVSAGGIETITLSGGALLRPIDIVLDASRNVTIVQVPIDGTALVNLYGDVESAYIEATR